MTPDSAVLKPRGSGAEAGDEGSCFNNTDAIETSLLVTYRPVQRLTLQVVTLERSGDTPEPQVKTR